MFYRKVLYGLTLMLAFSFFTMVSAQDKETGNVKTKTHQMDQKVNDEKAAAKPWNEVCPVKGGKVQKETALIEYKDKQYGFCCPGCDTKFEKDPEKYSKNLSEDGKEFIGKK